MWLWSWWIWLFLLVPSLAIFAAYFSIPYRMARARDSVITVMLSDLSEGFEDFIRHCGVGHLIDVPIMFATFMIARHIMGDAMCTNLLEGARRDHPLLLFAAEVLVFLKICQHTWTAFVSWRVANDLGRAIAGSHAASLPKEQRDGAT